jgi:hypothetical protein
MTTVDGEDFFLKEEYVEISLPKHVFRVLYNIRGLMPPTCKDIKYKLNALFSSLLQSKPFCLYT